MGDTGAMKRDEKGRARCGKDGVILKDGARAMGVGRAS
jgi:hypothetical protein